MQPAQAQRATAGAVYFEGWTRYNQVYTHLTPSLMNDYADRQPVWGWYSDGPDGTQGVQIMQQQIDLAADHGIAFFAFCWYWRPNAATSIDIPYLEGMGENQGLLNYMKTANKSRLKFCLIICNHSPLDIMGYTAWQQGADYWLHYLQDPQALTINGKPVLMIYNIGGADLGGLQYLEQLAQQNGLPGVAVIGMGWGWWLWDQGAYPVSGWGKYNEGLSTNGSPTEARSYIQLGPWYDTCSPFPCLPVVMAGADGRPWGYTGPYYNTIDHTPAVFAGHIQNVLDWMDQHPNNVTAERIFTIYAWNENGEGGYFMPTMGDPGGGFLDALQTTLGYTSTTVAVPSISPAGGGFTDSVEVSIACATEGATIRYTTDGSNPTSSSTQYTAPFTLTQNTTVKAKAFKNGLTDSPVATAVFTKTVQGPYRGTPAAVPGIIEAEDFDTGGEGVAYHDVSSGNEGGEYRTDENVDLEACADAGGGYNVGWLVGGEWLAYTVSVATAGTYTIEVRVASTGDGGTFHLEFDGADKTGPLTVPNTGGWQNWQTMIKPGVSLTAGEYVMRIVIDGNSTAGYAGNLNYIRIGTGERIDTRLPRRPGAEAKTGVMEYFDSHGMPVTGSTAFPSGIYYYRRGGQVFKTILVRRAPGSSAIPLARSDF